MKKKPGPKPRQWTKEERGIVRGMALGGVPHDRIAAYLKTTGETLRKYFRDELDHGMDEMKALATRSIAHHLSKMDKTMTILFLKTQCGWKETVDHEHSGGVEVVINVPTKA